MSKKSAGLYINITEREKDEVFCAIGFILIMSCILPVGTAIISSEPYVIGWQISYAFVVGIFGVIFTYNGIQGKEVTKKRYVCDANDEEINVEVD